mmetsp:Transcript_154017/g.373935  ORF Transcript_154017/g.373935 Transcript_154017/m.373935 type:complete len:112 (+) Transcript_154017:578-913(+)
MFALDAISPSHLAMHSSDISRSKAAQASSASRPTEYWCFMVMSAPAFMEVRETLPRTRSGAQQLKDHYLPLSSKLLSGNLVPQLRVQKSAQGPRELTEECTHWPMQSACAW